MRRWRSALIRSVSIHASRCREAMPRFLKISVVRLLFQSTPPVAGRRCALANQGAFEDRMFQSTPPVAGRRCFRDSDCDVPGRWFQSTPPVAGRRCLVQFSWLNPQNGKFQSTPPVAGRRCQLGDITKAAIAEFQSTPPVAGRRCQMAALMCSTCTPSFNPRLPLPGGDATRSASR